MRWSDERWIKLYTRDEPDWCCVSLGARGLFYELMRKVDKAGTLTIKKGTMSIAAIVHASEAEIEPLIQELIEEGAIEITHDIMIIPAYVDAQEARTSDKERKRRERERDRDIARSPADVSHNSNHATKKLNDCVDSGTIVSHDVTACHTVSHDVTASHAVSRSREEKRREENKRASIVPTSVDKQKKIDAPNPDFVFDPFSLSQPEVEIKAHPKLKAIPGKNRPTLKRLCPVSETAFDHAMTITLDKCSPPNWGYFLKVLEGTKRPDNNTVKAKEDQAKADQTRTDLIKEIKTLQIRAGPDKYNQATEETGLGIRPVKELPGCTVRDLKQLTANLSKAVSL